jgi:hypothetical protein
MHPLIESQWSCAIAIGSDGEVGLSRSVKGLVRGQQQQGARTALRKRTGRECLIAYPWGYAIYLNVSLHTSTP